MHRSDISLIINGYSMGCFGCWWSVYLKDVSTRSAVVFFRSIPLNRAALSSILCRLANFWMCRVSDAAIAPAMWDVLTNVSGRSSRHLVLCLFWASLKHREQHQWKKTLGRCWRPENQTWAFSMKVKIFSTWGYVELQSWPSKIFPGKGKCNSPSHLGEDNMLVPWYTSKWY